MTVYVKDDIVLKTNTLCCLEHLKDWNERVERSIKQNSKNWNLVFANYIFYLTRCTHSSYYSENNCLCFSSCHIQLHESHVMNHSLHFQFKTVSKIWDVCITGYYRVLKGLCIFVGQNPETSCILALPVPSSWVFLNGFFGFNAWNKVCGEHKLKTYSCFIIQHTIHQ